MAGETLPNPPAAPQPGSPEYEAAMAAKGASAVPGTTPAGAPPARPDHIPEKFWDTATGQVKVEALAKSYAELERARGGAPAGTPPAPGQGLNVPTPPVPQPGAAKVDMGKFTQEFASAGALSEASYAELQSLGYDKALVDGYITGEIAKAQLREQQGMALAGGADQYTQMVSWAAGALTPAEIQAFNSAVSGSPEQMKLAITALKAQYEAANGKEPSLAGGPAGGNADTQAFASWAEVTVAMRDPRYHKDPAYRAIVERRVGMMKS